MASALSAFRVSICRISTFRARQFSYPATSALSHTKRIMCTSSQHSVSSSDISSSLMETNETWRWRPMCLYYTHGKCTKVNTLPPFSLSLFKLCVSLQRNQLVSAHVFLLYFLLRLFCQKTSSVMIKFDQLYNVHNLFDGMSE